MKILKLKESIILMGLFAFSCTSNDANGKHSDTDTSKNSGSQANETTSKKSFKYDLDHPQKKWKLIPDLLEISGNTMVDENHLLVIEDLRPDLYLLRLDADTAVVEKKVRFKDEKPGEKFDVEDVTLVNNTVYALWSHGAIFKINDWQGKPDVKEIKTFLKKENNTEGICYDPVTKNLLVTCKGASDVEDEKKSTRAVYEYDLSGDSLKSEPFMLIHKKDFKKASDEKVEFYPSAIAVHPITHDIYILGTKDSKGMAVFTHSGELISFNLIDKEVLPQPEGICFSPDGTLYISTEGKEGGAGYLCRYDFAK
ncbi:MAG: SdiA-regulated domain-containing protein [Ginsengibacter sp.]